MALILEERQRGRTRGSICFAGRRRAGRCGGYEQSLQQTSMVTQRRMM
uniref:Uncharacterized protein n=1 Tax=Arundo donax TaxID=35708 RepID=A0A0A9N358_ARUDO